MVCHLDADLLLLVAVGPVEDAGLLGKDLERAKLFAARLDYLNRLEGAINHQVSGLEANQLAEREGRRQEGHNCDELKHCPRPGVVLCVLAVNDLNWSSVQPRKVEWNSGPFGVTYFEFEILCLVSTEQEITFITDL